MKKKGKEGMEGGEGARWNTGKMLLNTIDKAVTSVKQSERHILSENFFILCFDCIPMNCYNSQFMAQL